jgi:hypothetical protein
MRASSFGASSMSARAILFRSAGRRVREAAVLALSTAFSVMAIATFASAAASPRFGDVLSAKESARNLLMASSVAIVFFVALSGWYYAEHYLRRRKRELASWLLLGMSRRSALGAISAEFAASSLVALVGGLGLSLVFSRFFALVLAALMRDHSPLPLPFGAVPILCATAACAAQWAVSTLRASFELRRATLAELMKAEKTVEEPPKERLPAAIAGIALIALGYATAALVPGAISGAFMLPVLAVVVAGTFLVFGTAFPALIGAFRARGIGRGARRLGRDASALVAVAQLSFRSRRNARLLAFSAVLVAMAASAIGSVLALDITDQASARRICPHDIELAAATPGGIERIEAALAEQGVLRVGEKRRDIEWLSGSIEAEGKELRVRVFSASAWNAAVQALGERPLALGTGESRSFLGSRIDSRSGSSRSFELKVGSSSLSLPIRPDKDLPPLSVLPASAALAFDDAAYAELRASAFPSLVKTSAIWDGLSPEAVRAAAPSFDQELASSNSLISRAVMMDAQGQLYGVLLFIGAFLAATFVLAAASLLAFRSIEDARDDSGRYLAMLRLGSPMETLRKALLIQNAASFGAPLAVGLLHTVFALIMMRNISGYANLAPTLIVSACLVAVMSAAAIFATDRQAASVRSLIIVK